MADFTWDNDRVLAAQLVAYGELSIVDVASKVGVTDRTIYNWQANEAFAARVDEILDEVKRSLRRRAISHAERRVDRLNRDWLRLQRVIEERAADPRLAHVPGGTTGLIVRNVKGVGKGDDFQLIDLYEVDTALLKELRETEKQAAQELGQWAERTEISGPDKGLIPVVFQESLMKAYGKPPGDADPDATEGRQ